MAYTSKLHKLPVAGFVSLCFTGLMAFGCTQAAASGKPDTSNAQTPPDTGDVALVEVLYFDDCPNHEALLPRLHELLERAGIPSRVELRRIADDESAQREQFLGSPTVRVSGRDIEPGAENRDDYGLKCRIYATSEGRRGVPADEWLFAALGQGK